MLVACMNVTEDTGARPVHREVAFPVPPDLTIEQRRALQLLVEAPNGMTDTEMRVHGFSPALIVGLFGAGYTEAKPRTMKAAGRWRWPL
jgi:hypothetical protein